MHTVTLGYIYQIYTIQVFVYKYLKVLVHRVGYGIFWWKFSIYKTQCFIRSSLERNHMHGSINFR